MLQLINLFKSYPMQEAPALKEVNFSLNKGDFCIILGNNGSGKSTLFKTILGEETLDQGQILLGEKNITSLAISQRAKIISSVNQEIHQSTILELSLLENIVLNLSRGQKRSFSKINRFEKIAKEIMKGLNPDFETKLHSSLSLFSGGQRQMIATCLALQNKPELLLLDEHTSALDPKTQNHLMTYTAEKIQENNITALMITHNLAHALAFGNRLIMMQQGEVILDLKQDEKNKLNEETLLSYFYQVKHPLRKGAHHVRYA